VFLPCLLLGLCSGCHNEDVERLGKVWHRVGEQLGHLTSGVRLRLSRGWCAVEGKSKSPTVLCERVLSRLRTDKSLSASTIEVTVAEATVTLRGSVPDAALRQRAVELARETLGVEQVVDELAPKE
jgi:hypothetical protein